MEQSKKPILIYDGDCTFCQYWVDYWHKVTGDQVIYKPYQEVKDQYPQISVESFQRAVQYVSPNGEIASAAKASFLTLAEARDQRFWLTLYQKLPGFAGLSEKAYSVISSHRSFFYKLTLLFWGRNYEPPRYNFVSWIFNRCLGLIFLFAFISFESQALGLIGSQGMVPISELVTAVSHQLGIERYWLLPMLFWFNASDLMIQMVCWSGIGFSILLILNFLPRISLVFLYILYLSLVCAGQAFMSFQWDALLLETGMIALLSIRPYFIGILLIRWLLFRFMWAGGLVKILSGDPTWKNLTALNYYFVTQPLPTPLAWYIQKLPPHFLQFGTAATLFIELFIPFFIFFPRNIRFFAGFIILFLQFLILISGNYNFFNLLTMVLCLALFDDASFVKIIPRRLINFVKKPIKKAANTFWVISVSVFASTTIFISLLQFQLRFVGPVPQPLMWIYAAAAPFHIVNLYGPFAVMTTKRLEIIIQGSNDGYEWQEYSFKYKPGDVYRRPLWNIPFQPRLDWQMWFAALSPPETNLWFLRFLQRLLENSPTVLALLEKNPFKDKPPQYIRAQFYDYQFTGFKEKNSTGAWWKREYERIYFPQVRLPTENYP